METLTLKLTACHLSKEQWTKEMLAAIEYPPGFTLGLTDDEYTDTVRDYIVDIVVETVNEQRIAAGVPTIYHIKNGDLYIMGN
jgi:hypothetical protein